jgi:vacuolar-type H+-ATPase subunit C/Vma6
MTRMSENTAYGFAVGRVRALENSLLGRGQYDRLLRVAGPVEFAAALQDVGYGRFFDSSAAGDAVEAALNAALADYVGFLMQYAIDPWLAHLFQIPVDTQNLKTAIKAARVGVGEPLFLPGGAWTKAQVGGIAAGESAAVDGVVVDTVKPLLAGDRPADATAIDAAVDRLEQRLTLAAVAPSGFLSGFARLRADLENSRTAARLKAAGEEFGEAEALLLDGGTITEAQLRSAIGGDWESFPRALGDDAGIGHVLEEGVARFTTTGSLLHWERVSREAELGYLRGSRYAIFGHEPLATFHYFRLNELRNLRGLNAAQRAGVDADVAQELVAYVD